LTNFPRYELRGREDVFDNHFNNSATDGHPRSAARSAITMAENLCREK